MLASLPERARRLRWTDAAALRTGPDVLSAARGETESASEERRRRRRGRSSEDATAIVGRLESSGTTSMADWVGPVGVVSMGASEEGVARGVERGVEGEPDLGEGTWGISFARRPDEKKEE